MKKNIKKVWNAIKRNLDKRTAIVANFCQIIIVVLAIVEYQRNIKPTFQNQLLSEENARLLLENNKIKEESEKINSLLDIQVVKKQQELEQLQKKYENLTSDYELASQKLIALETEQSEKELAIKKKQDKENIVDSIYSFRSLISENCQKSRSQKFFDYSTTVLAGVSNHELPNNGVLDQIDELLDFYFLNPYTNINKSLDIIQNNNTNKQDETIREYINSFRFILNQKENYLVYDEQKVQKLRNKLFDYQKKKIQLEEKINSLSDKDIITKVKRKNEIYGLENQMFEDMEEVSRQLIDVGDIIKPVINEMVDMYLLSYDRTN